MSTEYQHGFALSNFLFFFVLCVTEDHDSDDIAVDVRHQTNQTKKCDSR